MPVHLLPPISAAGPAREIWISLCHSWEKQLQAGGWQTGLGQGWVRQEQKMGDGRKRGWGEEQELQVWAQSCLQ